jgi:hypothetical protein
MKLIFIIGSIMFFAVQAFAQTGESNSVRILRDSRVDTLLVRHIQFNEQNPGTEGWRIEIFFEAGNYSKSLAIEAKAGFVEKYSSVSSYLLFFAPYYKVRVGDFRTKMDAEKFLHEIEMNYPDAFIVKDKINFPPLK